MKTVFNYSSYFVSDEVPLNHFILTEINTLTYTGTEVYEDGGRCLCLNGIDPLEARIVGSYLSLRNINVVKDVKCEAVNWDNMGKTFLFLYNHKSSLAIVVDDMETIRNKILAHPTFFIFPSPNPDWKTIQVDMSPLLTILS